MEQLNQLREERERERDSDLVLNIMRFVEDNAVIISATQQHTDATTTTQTNYIIED